MNTANTVKASKITLSELMLPSHSNFSGKIHGGHFRSLIKNLKVNNIVACYFKKKVIFVN
jgi:acyl-CoA hydrolase